MRQFNRIARVQVADRRYTDLHVGFEIEKTDRSAPNKASISVYNLSQESRNQIQELSATRRNRGSRIRTVLETAYGDAPLAVIFSGDLRTATSSQEGGATWVTKIEGEDAGRAHLWSRVNLSFPPNATLRQVARAAAEAMEVGLGNLDDALRDATLEDGTTTYPAGTVLSGSAPEELRGVLHSAGLTFSIQDNVLQVLRRGRALQRTAVRLTDTTGLVENAEKQVDGTVKVKCLLNPDIYPGRQIQVESRNVNGTFRCRKVKYKGEIAANDWYCEIEAQELLAIAD